MGNKLYVGNLAYAVRDEDLNQAFGQFGTVTSAKVMMDRDTGRSKGFGFVEMGSDAEAQSAIEGMSSTAIVVKLMAERLELETEHGRRVMGVLLFQDLAVVPLLVLIPALGQQLQGDEQHMGRALLLAGLKAALLLTVLLVGGQRVMRWWLTLVARRRSEELFMLNLLLVTLGLAWLTEHAGLSLALGAFVAGMLIAETEYKHQVETDIRPFHDVLLGLFFITIGMKLDLRAVADQWTMVALLTTVPVLFKFGLVTALARAFRATPGGDLNSRARPAMRANLATTGPSVSRMTSHQLSTSGCQSSFMPMVMKNRPSSTSWKGRMSASTWCLY